MNRIAWMCAALLAAAPLACKQSPEGGSPGSNDSFKLQAPVMPEVLKQGERETLTLKLDRGSDFKKSVKIDVKAPEGLKVDPAHKTVKASDPAEVSITIEADKKAAAGDHKITVVATPESGNPTSLDVTVKVREGPKS